MPLIRTFIAVRVPQNPLLRQLHERLSQSGERIRPVRVNGLHVTLRFLGDTERSLVDEIAARMRKIAAEHPADVVRLTGLGVFPDLRRPSVVWVGMQNAGLLSVLAGELNRELAELGFVPEQRPFQPHLTVLRLKTRPPAALLDLIAAAPAADFGSFPVDTLELIQSELEPAGPRYTVLASAPLCPANESASDAPETPSPEEPTL